MENNNPGNRKADHIQMAFDAQANEHDTRFNYEPVLKAHALKNSLPPVHLAGRVMRAPLWVSSMTGGTEHAAKINRNLAMACKEFGLGMGLGSCRPLLDNTQHLNDFAVRNSIGEQPLFANLGIAQVEQLIALNKMERITELIKQLEADGLIVHINPLQEWLQPEGDIIEHAPIDTIKRLLDAIQFPIMVKEVGQGFGPKSMQQLAELPLEAIDFGAHGGTNFSQLENFRNDVFLAEQYKSVAGIGHSAGEMTEMARKLIVDPEQSVHTRCFIVSGGIQSFLDGYYHLRRIPYKAIYAQASVFLKYAMESEEALFRFVESQIKGLEMAYNYLTPKDI